MNTSPALYGYVTAGLYWLLVLFWSVILAFYWREHRRITALTPIVATMLVVVFIDGARTLLESIYFGTIMTSRAGLIPSYLQETLEQPQYVLLPKLLNLGSALTIVVVLIRRWFKAMRDEAERQRKVEGLFGELQTAHSELSATHDQLRLAHDELRETHQELTEAQEAREALTHMIVHDMRTPLTAVITGLQTVQQVPDDPELAAELTGSALGGAGKLLDMVNDLLDISKMESGMMTIHADTFAVRDALSDAVALVAPLAREAGVELVTNIDVPGVTPVIGDREFVRRIAVNLLGNALKFSPAGSAIQLGVAMSGSRAVRVSIADSGPGIPLAHREKIFLKFHQVGNGGSRRTHSTGLGLTFCKMAAEAMGGEIGVECGDAGGSTFWFTLPVASGA